MDVAAFCRQSHVLVVVGKGGVGKTTATASLALMAASRGLNVLVVALDDSGDLPALFGRDEPFGYEEVELAGPDPASRLRVPGHVRARVITSDAALLEYLDEHGLRRVSRRLVASGALDIVATAIPGIEEVLVLGKVKQIERAQTADVILIDAPATGHALTFLTSPGGLVDAARGGPLRQQAEQVVELLSDPSRCQAIPVTLPEETPVNELIETAFFLEDSTGVALGPVVVNGCYPSREGLDADPAAAAAAAGARVQGAELRRLGAAAAFRRARLGAQAEQLERLSSSLPLPQLRLPFLFSAEIGPNELGRLAEVLAEQVTGLPTPSSAATGPAR
ncbi:MAG: P-loop NTPase [Actinomycetota bacterium]|jgi:hypothetical protein|nr:P-loop NTPase [Actinomycetota bacterium]